MSWGHFIAGWRGGGRAVAYVEVVLLVLGRHSLAMKPGGLQALLQRQLAEHHHAAPGRRVLVKQVADDGRAVAAPPG
jgi:hypothetical protein